MLSLCMTEFPVAATKSTSAAVKGQSVTRNIATHLPVTTNHRKSAHAERLSCVESRCQDGGLWRRLCRLGRTERSRDSQGNSTLTVRSRWNKSRHWP